MKPAFPLAAAAALALATIPNAQADPRQHPTVEYMADYTSDTQGEPQGTGNIYYTKDRIRIDVNQAGTSVVMIVDKVKKQVVYLHPATKTYKPEPLDDPDIFNPYASGGWEITKAGEEVVAGVPTTKWEVKPAEKAMFQGFVWTTKENIQVKADGVSTDEGKTSENVFELKNLKIGPVDAAVFEIPAGYKRED